ncbi:hypothetical protein QYE76_019384 [Lolium multiflorum]|uniref:Retrotransposon gag domain-containing protein n=1 Tax=Lolium multiflorum TaxID=4521 RepID=A0AAD8R3Y8_LOLMU|nr:hypothetical protein QYE76_019384 [Lolium multiflorum]
MAYAVTIPRHLAPTVGPSASSAGVFIRTGLTITTGERVASGLIWRFGSRLLSDNAGCFADRPFPAGGSVISFGGHDVYVATVAPPRYPRQVLRCASPPPRAGSSAPASPVVVQVMMAGEELPTKNPRARGPNLERNIDPNASGSGPKAPPPPSRLDAVRAKLSTPLTPGADPTAIEADLEAHRQLLLKQTEELAAAKRQMEITQREYNRAHGLTPGGDEPSRAGHIRRRGRDLGAEIARDGLLRRLRPRELPTRRVTELLNAANRQIADPRYVNAPRASHARGAAGNDREGARDTAESSSPAPSRRHDSRATHSSGRPSHQPSGSSRSRPPPSRNQEQDSGPRRHHRPAPEASGARQPAHSRLGPRIEPADARDRLDRLVESRIAEEEAPAGPKCFGPRIANEPTLEGFTLPRDTPKYDGTAKPEDWLQDYSTAVGIAKGNKRWAVRYSPLMLVGSARTWLNNLPAGSINGWLDFEAAFISNFTGTYRRPGRPQQLEMCKQGPDETDRAYLTRWCEMRNSCEGVHEIQAISFFMGGCRPNTMLWHKLRRSDPKSMAALMAIADNVRFSRVLIDGGSSINILYRDTARKLGIQEAELRPTPTVFHGIVPGHCCQPIGRITLEVMFGKPDHFRRESRVITVAGDYRRSMDCATQSSKMAQTLVIATEKQLIHDAVALAKAAQTDMPAAGNPAGMTHFQPADNTKKILLDPAQPDKFVTIGAGLNKK